MNWTNIIYYEQPANELIRACLRLEHLFAKLDIFADVDTEYHTRAAIQTLLEIITVLDRPDLKASLTKELNRNAQYLMKLEQIPNVDHAKLKAIIDDLNVLSEYIGDYNGKLAQSLRQNDFLNVIRLHINNPGGSLNFDNPAYHYWLKQSTPIRFNNIHAWMEELSILNRIITMILQLVRESSVPQYKTAHEGFYQDALDTKQPCQLIRVGLPKDARVFPEISVGRHRICVRFCNPSITDKSKQTQQDVMFALTCCIF